MKKKIKKLIRKIRKMTNVKFMLLSAFIMIFIFNLVLLLVINALNEDLVKKNNILERDNTQLKWELEQVDQMICNNDEYE